MTFIIGTGRVYLGDAFSWRKRLTCLALDAAQATAIETASMAFAPSLLLFLVPSRLIIVRSIFP